MCNIQKTDNIWRCNEGSFKTNIMLVARKTFKIKNNRREGNIAQFTYKFGWNRRNLLSFELPVVQISSMLFFN